MGNLKDLRFFRLVYCTDPDLLGDGLTSFSIVGWIQCLEKAVSMRNIVGTSVTPTHVREVVTAPISWRVRDAQKE